ncbi:MAG: YajQ family cyclic di-GMP-binding protein [Alphaproteobacteria bacterium]|nr:YajQ family cyclic di-GMP-binding protein [Alphaproteobacteria bacterium]
MPSFDIVSRTDLQEVDNAVQGVKREIAQRFDFKGSQCTIERAEQIITILADDDMKLRHMQELLRVYMTRRKTDPHALSFGDPERAAGNRVRQAVTIRQGVDRELGKQISQALKETKLKIQIAIQGDELRVSGKKLDELQAAIAAVKALGIEHPLQYVNFRS